MYSEEIGDATKLLIVGAIVVVVIGVVITTGGGDTVTVGQSGCVFRLATNNLIVFKNDIKKVC
jgi:hypothetical protein